MRIRTVLVVGAGIAGSTLAWHLARCGITTLVVERAGGQRSSGSPVDVRGPALGVLEQMSVLAPVRAAATRTTRLAAVDARGRVVGWMPTRVSPGAIEIPRSDLAAILASAAREDAEFRYDDTVVALRDDGSGVEVTFERAAPRRFDLVVGADGLHSTVRRLVLGPEQQFTTHLGLYIATVTTDRAAADPHTVLIHNVPGRAVVVHPGTGREGAAFLFRHPLLPGGSVGDVEEQKQLLTEIYEGVGWRAPELLEHLRGSDEPYFDSISRVRLPRWSRDRTVLVGDAADCVSLLGEGSSTAITGAATLAQALAAHPTRPSAALQHYEHVHRRRVLPHHRGAATAGHLLVPATRVGLAARDTALRTWAAAASTRERLRAGRPSSRRAGGRPGRGLRHQAGQRAPHPGPSTRPG